MRNIFLFLFLSLGILFLTLYIYIKNVINTLEFNFKLDNLNLGNLTSESLKKDNTFVKIKLLFIIRFFGLFNINIEDLNIKAYYNGKLIASSSIDLENYKKITLISGVNNSIYHSFDVQLNSNTLDLITKIKTKNKYIIDYQLSFKILGLTIKYTGKYE